MKVKVVSLNTWHGGRLFDEMVAFLRQEAPDVVMMQEVYAGTDPELERRFRTVPVLQAELGYAQAHFAAVHLEVFDWGRLEAGNGVLSRWPIAKTEVTPFCGSYGEYRDVPEEWPTAPCNLQRAVVEAPGGTLNIFNFHGPVDYDGDNPSPRRREMSEVLIRETKGKRNVILAGDTNAKPTNPAMLAIEKHLQPAFKPDIVSTFNMRHKDNPGYATAVVDLMYVSREIKVLRYECPDVDISDHRPIVAELEVPER
jgi:endonuclease/exonuclease/phosphatase family metal-dependent hydrolase